MAATRIDFGRHITNFHIENANNKKKITLN